MWKKIYNFFFGLDKLEQEQTFRLKRLATLAQLKEEYEKLLKGSKNKSYRRGVLDAINQVKKMIDKNQL